MRSTVWVIDVQSVLIHSQPYPGASNAWEKRAGRASLRGDPPWGLRLPAGRRARHWFWEKRRAACFPAAPCRGVASERRIH